MLAPGEAVRRFTLVVSQFEKTGTIRFSVRAYSTLAFTLEKIKSPWRHKEEVRRLVVVVVVVTLRWQVTGQWKGLTAGGCANNKETWANNPRYQLVVDSPSHLQVPQWDPHGLVISHPQVQLKGPKQFQLGFDLVTVTAPDSSSPHYFRKKSSGLYRSGFVVVSLEVVAGTYELVPSTYLPQQESSFFLTVASSATFRLTKMR